MLATPKKRRKDLSQFRQSFASPISNIGFISNSFLGTSPNALVPKSVNEEIVHRSFLKPKNDISVFLQKFPNPLLARLLPYSLLRWYIRLLGSFYYATKRHEKTMVLTSYLNSVMTQGAGEVERMAVKRMFLGIFDHYAEKLFFAFKPPSESYKFLFARSRIPNRKPLDRMVLAGGGLLVTGHFGAVEFLAGVLAAHDYKVAVIARFKTQKLKKALSKVVQYYDILAIDAEEGSSLIAGLKAVRRGRILVTLCDEFKHWRPSFENSVDIFGTVVPEDKTLNLLHRRLKCPACLGLLSRSNEHYELHITKLADRKASTSLSSRSWKILAEYISKYPEQWYQWSSVAKGLAAYRLKEK